MSDLGSQIRRYVDDIVQPLEIEDVRQPVADDGAVPATSQTRPRVGWVAAAAAAACVAVLAGLLVVERSSDSADRVEAGLGTTVTDDWAWLAQFGTEVPAPPVPDGWTALDFGEVRFAVPADWVVPVVSSCDALADGVPGVVLISDGVEPTSGCSPEVPLPDSVLTIAVGSEQERTGGPTRIGTFSATSEGPECAGCEPVYTLENGYLVSVSGPESQSVLDTFTDSGARRVLQAGDEADTSGWRSIDFEGLSMLVPPEWESLDLPGSYTEQQTENGGLRVSGYPDPGSCGATMFPSEGARVFLGTSLYEGSCPSSFGMDLTPGDGIWIRSGQDGSGWTDGDRDAIGTPLAQGEANGLDITVVQVDRLSSRSPSPVLDLVVDDGETVHWISLGVGLDTSLARSLLRSLRALDETSDGPAPETAPTSLPEDCIWPAAGTAAFLNTLVDDGLNVGFVASYESDDEGYENLFFLSAEIDGGELDGPGDVATWASNVSGYAPPIDSESGSAPRLPSYLSFVPVNELATTISSALGPLRAPTMDTDGAAESQECLAPRPVPDLVGISQVVAVRLLEGNGFTAEVTGVSDPVAAVGEVVRTDPSARTSLAPGSTVTVSVSLGPESGPTTDLPSPTESEATSTVARPEVSFTYADGTVGSLEDFAGTTIVLGFFSSLCVPCRQTLEAMQQAADEYGSGVAVIGVQTQDTLAGQFVQEQGVEFPIVSDPEGAVLEALGGFALPAIVVLDAEGGAGPVHTGLVSIDALRAAIDEDLLG